VVNQSFHAETVAEGEIEKEPIWQNPLVRDILKLVAGLVIIALLVLFVVRPLIRGLAAPTRAMLAAGPAGLQGPAGEVAMAAQVASRPGTAIAYEQQIAQVRSLVAKDPARVAQVVKDWVQKDE
jgi:flagellar M-ring protein FliF